MPSVKTAPPWVSSRPRQGCCLAYEAAAGGATRGMPLGAASAGARSSMQLSFSKRGRNVLGGCPVKVTGVTCHLMSSALHPRLRGLSPLTPVIWRRIGRSSCEVAAGAPNVADVFAASRKVQSGTTQVLAVFASSRKVHPKARQGGSSLAARSLAQEEAGAESLEASLESAAGEEEHSEGDDGDASGNGKEQLLKNGSAVTANEASTTVPLLTWQLVSALMWQQSARLAVAVVALIGGTACNVSIPRVSGRFIQSLVSPGEHGWFTTLVPLAVLYVMEPLWTMLYVTNLCAAWEKVMAALRLRLFARVLSEDVSFFDKHKVTELTSMLSTELNYIEKGVTDNVTRDRGFRSLFEVLSSLVILFVICPDIAPVLCSAVVAISIVAGLYKRSTMALFRGVAMAQARFMTCANETLSAIRTVRSFNGERRQLSVFASHVAEAEQLGSSLAFFKSTNEAWTRGAVYFSLLGIYSMCGSRVRAGTLSSGALLSFVGYVFILTFAVQGFINTVADLQNVFAAAARINSIVRFPAQVQHAGAGGAHRSSFSSKSSSNNNSNSSNSSNSSREEVAETSLTGKQQNREGASEGAGELLSQHGDSSRPPYGSNGMVFKESGVAFKESEGKWGQNGSLLTSPYDMAELMTHPRELAWEGDIAFEGVHFSYPQRADVEVIKGINLRLPRGTVTALVGGSGAGKTTVVQLLCRFYRLSGGRISLGGRDVESFDQSEWADAVALVSQEPVLFAMSVRDNIAYGRPEGAPPVEDEIIAAAKAANAHDFIMALPNGYDTDVGERGGLLSGGQRQRIAIARAVLKDAPVLILDEATSALDSVSERLVQDALSKLMVGRTTVVIAHRLSTVQAAQQIAVMSQGRIVERGSHFELLALGGAYAELVNSQHLTFTS